MTWAEVAIIHPIYPFYILAGWLRLHHKPFWDLKKKNPLPRVSSLSFAELRPLTNQGENQQRHGSHGFATKWTRGHVGEKWWIRIGLWSSFFSGWFLQYISNLWTPHCARNSYGNRKNPEEFACGWWASSRISIKRKSKGVKPGALCLLHHYHPPTYVLTKLKTIQHQKHIHIHSFTRKFHLSMCTFLR